MKRSRSSRNVEGSNKVISSHLDLDEMLKIFQKRSLDSKTTGNKKSSKNYKKVQGRASQFKGVSKNGNNWQVLININYEKKYIGTFKTETQAALAYDFYALAFHKTNARTNFSYDQKIVEDMVSSYSTNLEFIPEEFESRVISLNSNSLSASSSKA